MTHPDPYHLWRQGRADADAPPGFADRVMDAVRREERVPIPSRSLGEVVSAWFASPLVRTVACVLAGLACTFRLLLVVAVFFSR